MAYQHSKLQSHRKYHEEFELTSVKLNFYQQYTLSVRYLNEYYITQDISNPHMQFLCTEYIEKIVFIMLYTDL